MLKCAVSIDLSLSVTHDLAVLHTAVSLAAVSAETLSTKKTMAKFEGILRPLRALGATIYLLSDAKI